MKSIIVMVMMCLALSISSHAQEKDNVTNTSSLFGDIKAPESVKTAVASGYPGYELVRCSEVNMGKGKKFYKLTLRKDRKTTRIYMDEQGTWVQKSTDTKSKEDALARRDQE